jgi:hypothetical protein
MMLRQSIKAASLRRTAKGVQSARTFATSARRQAEVELTIGADFGGLIVVMEANVLI